jgi:S1-C subfamily serine protease
MGPEDEGDGGAPEPDDTPRGPPPNPLDRPWVHPSELRSFTSTPALTPPESRPRDWVIAIGSATAAVIATILVLVAFGALGGRHRSPLPPPVVTNANDAIDYSVAERVGTAVGASVVTVRATANGATRPVGSGVVMSSNRIATAAHNLNGATAVSAVTNSGDELPARVVGSDPVTDVAILSVSGGGLQLAKLAAPVPPSVGATVIAVSAGAHYRVGIDVVSDRDLMADTGTGVDVAGLLETGIPVTPEMSGGALVDPDGNLVGILTRPTAGGPDGLAIPISMVRAVQDQFDGSGKVAHGSMGVDCEQDPSPRTQGGAVVRWVKDDGPAAKAGLQPGDVIVRAGGRLIASRADLAALVRNRLPEDSLDVQYVRGSDRPKTVTVTLKAGDPGLMMLYAPGMS